MTRRGAPVRRCATRDRAPRDMRLCSASMHIPCARLLTLLLTAPRPRTAVGTGAVNSLAATHIPRWHPRRPTLWALMVARLCHDASAMRGGSARIAVRADCPTGARRHALATARASTACATACEGGRASTVQRSASPHARTRARRMANAEMGCATVSAASVVWHANTGMRSAHPRRTACSRSASQPARCRPKDSPSSTSAARRRVATPATKWSVDEPHPARA